MVDWDKTVVDWSMLTPVATSRSHIPDDIPEFNAPLERNPDDAPPSWILGKNQTGKQMVLVANFLKYYRLSFQKSYGIR